MSENPYVGPRAFRTGERLPARDFEAAELTDLLIAERVVLLHSPSGAGKTSLIWAGVLPLLEKKQVGSKDSTESFHPLPLRVKTPAPADRTLHNRYVYSAALDLLDAPRPPRTRVPDLPRSSAPRQATADERDPGASLRSVRGDPYARPRRPRRPGSVLPGAWVGTRRWRHLGVVLDARGLYGRA